MHNRHRNPRNERRSLGLSHRYRDARYEFNRRQEAVFKKAGKLAADYLVSIGMLSESSLRPRREGNDRFDEFTRRERSYRRNDDDGYDDRRRKRRRNGEYGSNWGRKMREERRWRERDWDYDDFRRENGRRQSSDRRPRGDEAGGLDLENWDGFGDLNLNNAVGGERGVGNLEVRDDEVMSYESGEVRDDDLDVETFEAEGGGGENGADLFELCRFVGVPTKPRTKRRRVDRSSSNNIKPKSKHTIDLNKAPPSDGDLVSDGEVKLDISGDLKGKTLCEEFDVAKSYHVSNYGDDLLKLCPFKNVPTKPRTSFGRRSSKTTKVIQIVEIVSEVSKAMEVGDLTVGVGVASDSQLNQSNISDGKELSNSSITPTEHVVDSVDQGDELFQSPTNFESSSQKVNVHEVIKLLGQPLKPELFEVFHMDEEMTKEHVFDQVNPVVDDFSQKIETELNIKMEVEEQLQPTLFKVCDLNLMAPPEIPSEIIEVQDDPISDHLHKKEIPMGFDLIMGNTSIITNGYFQLSGDKMIPVIDLEDDFLIESNDYDSPKPKSENMHSSLSNHTENEELGSYGSTSPANAILELHQTDTFGGSLAPLDLNSPAT